MEVNPQVIGARIRQKRLEGGLSQTGLAEKIGVSPPAINRFEKGIKTPSIETLAKLAKALGASTDFLLGAGSENDVFLDEELRNVFRDFKQLSQEKRQYILQNIQFLKNK
jgi:transcriptional regulator with XRE-family HTH domain